MEINRSFLCSLGLHSWFSWEDSSTQNMLSSVQHALDLDEDPSENAWESCSRIKTCSFLLSNAFNKYGQINLEATSWSAK